MTTIASVCVCQWTGGCAEREIMARNSTPPSSLIVSVDVELTRMTATETGQPDSISLVDHRSRIASLQQLVQLFQQAKVPATWGFSNPVNSQAVPELIDQAGMHEVGLLGDASWVGLEKGRRGFCQQLVQRLADARRVGCELSTLALYDGQLQTDFDLLAKHQISMVRQSRKKQRAGKDAPRHRTLRYGLWEAPRAISVSPSTKGWTGRSRLMINKVVRRTIRHGGIGHLVLDMTTGQYDSPRGMKFVAQVLEMLNQHQRDEQLEVCTLRDVATRWQPSQQGVRARSLLRVAG